MPINLTIPGWEKWWRKEFLKMDVCNFRLDTSVPCEVLWNFITWIEVILEQGSLQPYPKTERLYIHRDCSALIEASYSQCLPAFLNRKLNHNYLNVFRDADCSFFWNIYICIHAHTCAQKMPTHFYRLLFGAKIMFAAVAVKSKRIKTHPVCDHSDHMASFKEHFYFSVQPHCCPFSPRPVQLE